MTSPDNWDTPQNTRVVAEVDRDALLVAVEHREEADTRAEQRAGAVAVDRLDLDHFRAEVREFMTPFPKDVITPAPGAKVGRLLHNIVPMVGLSYDY